MAHPFARAVVVAVVAAASVFTVAAPASAAEQVASFLGADRCIEAEVELPKGSPEISVCRPG